MSDNISKNNSNYISRQERRSNKKKGKRGKKKVKPQLPKYYLAIYSEIGVLQKYSQQNKNGETIYKMVGAKTPRIAAMNIWKGDKKNLGGQMIYLIDENDEEYAFDSTKWSYQCSKSNGLVSWKFKNVQKSKR